MKRIKGQHYLLSARARSLSLIELARLSDDDAYDLFKLSRWTGGEPDCPHCDCTERYHIKTLRQWRCKACNHSFSVTSGTIFANYKMPLQNYLLAIALFSNAAKGISALQMSRDLNVEYNTTWVICHKMRESLVDSEQEKLSGEVEMDSCYVNKHVRLANRIQDRIDRRLAKNQNSNQRAVMVLRERGEKGEGATKQRTFVTQSENQADAMNLAVDNIDRDATIYQTSTARLTGFIPNYSHGAWFTQSTMSVRMVKTQIKLNHSSPAFAVCSTANHKMDNLHMDRYANEAVDRENIRRESNGDIFKDIVSRCEISKSSLDFPGYWQGNNGAI